jgi:hypothetical protein
MSQPRPSAARYAIFRFPLQAIADFRRENRFSRGNGPRRSEKGNAEVMQKLGELNRERLSLRI